MNGNSGRWWVRLVVGGLCALALGTWFAPAQARAGCGDGLVPLHHTGPESSRTETGHGLPLAGQPDLSRPLRLPCPGPFCTRLPVVPQAPPASPPIRWVDEPGILSPFPPFIPSPPFDRLLGNAPPRPVRRACDVFHPPR
jgi:hypothetical protein